jgi:hypothetical protein
MRLGAEVDNTEEVFDCPKPSSVAKTDAGWPGSRRGEFDGPKQSLEPPQRQENVRKIARR